MIVWRVTVKIIRTVLYCIVYCSCAVICTLMWAVLASEWRPDVWFRLCFCAFFIWTRVSFVCELLTVYFRRLTTSELWWLSGGKREDYQNCSVLYCVLKLCTVISTLRWKVLTVLWVEFCHTGSISLWEDLFVLICVYFVCFCFIYTAYLLYYCECSEVDLMELKPNPEEPIFLQCFDTDCLLGHLTRKNLSPIWPIMCLVGL